MATLDFSGLEQLGIAIEGYAGTIDDMTDEMLIEGGKIIAEEWKKAAELAGHRDESHAGKHMIDSIAPGRPETDKYGYRKIAVFPRGKYPDRRDKYGQPISFAKVAAILNYGRSDMDGSDFIKKAEAAAAQRLDTLVRETAEKYGGDLERIASSGTITPNVRIAPKKSTPSYDAPMERVEVISRSPGVTVYKFYRPIIRKD